MKVLRGIPHPFGGEHVVASLPRLEPYARAAAGEPPLRKRLHFFAQRSLTHTALIDEQHSRMADAMRLGQSVAPGVIDGLELAVEGQDLVLLPGHAVAPDGQDLELAYSLRVRFDAVAVIAPRVEAELQSRHTGSTPWQRLSGLQRQATLAQVLGELGGAAFLPHAMVLVAVPRSIALDRSAAQDSPCPNATDDQASSRAAWEDGFQLAWVPWPTAQRPLPPWSDDGEASVSPRFRNRLAYAVFNAERERLSQSGLRSMRQWRDRSALAPDQLDALALEAAQQAARSAPWPWESLGVPLSVVAFDADFKPAFADRAAVLRQGGGRRNRSALVPWSGDDVLWQARVSQLLEHLAELPADRRNAQELQQQFDWLPPAGVLPLEVADFAARRQRFFPPQFDVSALPVPLDMVDALIAEAAPMLPFNLSLRDQVQLLVPVPSRWYDPGLLDLDERIHPLFDLEITRLADERLALLMRRDGLRRRCDVLTQAVVGSLPAYAQDDPNALPDESGALDAQAFVRVHRSSAPAGAAESHQFTGAHAKLALAASDELIVFVRIDAAPAAIVLRPLVSSDGGVVPPATQAFVWGSAPAEANGVRIGDLPPTGAWTRLAVPMSRAGLAGSRIDGLAFGMFSTAQAASQVSWGYAGKAANGLETYWLNDALPPGAVPGTAANWVWVGQGEAADADDLALGLPIEPLPATGGTVPAPPHARRVSELEALLAGWKNFRNGVLTVELGEPAGGVRNADTPPRTVDGGLDELITRLDGRIKAAGDHVDFGFLRARVDIFRLRQSVLGTDDAGRFLTSPAAAELVKRSENPVATEKEFADYFGRLSEKATKPPSWSAPAAQRAMPPAAAARTAATGISRFGGSALSERNTTLFVQDPVKPVALTPVSLVGEVAKPVDKIGAVAIDAAAAGGFTAIDVAAEPKKTVAVKDTVRPLQISVEAPPDVKDVVGASLIGATYNTVTVAERFTLPASVVSSNTAAKGKDDFVKGGLSGLKASGLVVDDLPVFGYRQGSGDDSVTELKAGDLLAGGLTDLDAEDVGDDQHEAVYFRRGIDAIDNSIRFLRGMELRAEDYRRLQADAKAARARIVAVTAGLQKRLADLAVKLAEVRHDLAVARALRGEEQARIDGLLARRKAILAEQVPFLVFRRPRLAPTLGNVPLLPAQPADVADPVPKCRSDAHDAPAELLALVDTLRDVPVRWLRPISLAFVKLDRLADLERVAAASQQRLALRQSSLPDVAEGRDTATGRMLAKTFERHAQRLDRTQGEALQRLLGFSAGSWKQAIEPLQRIASVRDLLGAGISRPELTLAAAGLLDDIAGVGACLHAAFCGVPPATRLRWVELFSQFDAAVSLRQLSALPGFGDETLGVDYLAWRRMQQLVDWLFAQVADEADALAAINDVVRVCLLLAAHAPVKRIVSARLRRPVPALVNTRLDIDIDPKTTRIGMQVLVQAPGSHTVLARAVVEDLSAGTATAVITQAVAGPMVMLDSHMRVQLQAAAPLGTAYAQKADAQAVQQQAAPTTAAKPAAAPPATQAADQRVARQVEAVRHSGARQAAKTR